MTMAYDLTLRSPDTLAITIIGELSSGAAAALRQEVERHAEVIGGPFRVLVNLHDALPMVPGARLEIVHMWRHPQLSTGALYGASRVVRTLEGVAIKAAGMAEWVRFFPDETSALDWLAQRTNPAH